LALGTFQVGYELARLTTGDCQMRFATPVGTVGVLRGILLMCLTGPLVA